MIAFGLITEGVTDQEVISNILAGFYDDPDILITELQPLRDETDKNTSLSYGGWGNLIEYCRSENFKQALQIINCLVIQVDTDVCEDYGVSKKSDGNDLSVEDLINKVVEKFIEIIGNDFYAQYQDRILFAISVHSIECWLLPVFYTDKRKSKIVNCLDTLNQELSKKKRFTIDKNNKNLDYYRDISEVFSKKKNLKKYFPHNPSFDFFIQKLSSIQIDDGLD